MDSLWEKNAQLPRFPRLEGDLRTDVLIIGGGLAGLLCAWKLHGEGIDCTLIEQNRIMGGVSGRTTAKITSQHGLIYGKLLQTFGAERAKLYWQANEDALADYRELAREWDFDFLPQSSCIFSTAGTDPLEKEMAVYRKLGIPARWEDDLPLPFPVSGGILFENQAQLHPLKFAACLVKGLKVYEQTKALAFLGNRVETTGGTVTAGKIIVTTHFPILNKHGAYFLKLYQQRSYVIALENAEPVGGMYLNCEENGLSLRSAGNWLLLGGGGHRTGKSGSGWTFPEAAAKAYWPDKKIVSRWATQDCMTLDGLPYIGCYSAAVPNLYVATGFQKWGMTTSMAATAVLTDLLLGKQNPCADLFSPNRSMLSKQLFVNGMDAAYNLIRPTRPRCPHLGCALRWNAMEHSWDCPCHGSRFDKEGKILNNPATDNLKKKYCRE